MAENNQCSTNSGSWIGTVIKTALIFGGGMLAGAVINSMLNDEMEGSTPWGSNEDEKNGADREDTLRAEGN